jgi:N-acetylneuraminate synthase/N,N'-diacetyllegionaminate synthase
VSVLPPDRVFVVCEAGVTNYGDVEVARRQVDAAAASGADAVKFQAWQTAQLVSRPVAERLRGELGYDWYDRMAERELTFEELRELHAYATALGLVAFATPLDEPSLDFLVGELAVPCVKVGSGEAANWRFLRRVGAAGKPVLIAFGLQSDDDARRAVDLLGDAGAPEVVAFHTVSVYPTPPELADLGRLARLRDVLAVPVGLSDHTVGRHIAVAAVALGARAVEKHLTFDRSDPRSLDNPGALEPDEFGLLVREIRELEEALAPPPREDERIARSRAWALQAVVAARPLPEGHVLAAGDVAFKRPGLGGVPAAEVDRLLGRKLRRAVAVDEQIRLEDVAEARG